MNLSTCLYIAVLTFAALLVWRVIKKIGGIR